ncbi:hypothetical protein [Bradyrhizobium yuanmingense]|uniref:hypothetical protein n=1 Tax=Bradyrhizobium yuanmingense TaxID=108015 RepID=UPI0023B9AC0A|nr:hypothetical protein [Bradyrhizobium yuanmingense]MDF0497208.1 hypothetical protein [Bradyrhizobium yuanmingense]
MHIETNAPTELAPIWTAPSGMADAEKKAETFSVLAISRAFMWTASPNSALHNLVRPVGELAGRNCVAGQKAEERTAGGDFWPNGSTSGECTYVH